jgi:hypothetical protein
LALACASAFALAAADFGATAKNWNDAKNVVKALLDSRSKR